MQQQTSGKPPYLATQWLEFVDPSAGASNAALAAIYGPETGILDERRALLRRVLTQFLERFGDRPVRICRAPGRINLRGMHVDTHGGYLNLMTHQREVVVAAAAAQDDTCTFANIEARFEEVTFRICDHAAQPAFHGDWMQFIAHPAARAAQGHWINYPQGAVLRAQHAFPGEALRGIDAVVGSDLPRGTALSSSHALCLATLTAMLAHNGKALGADDTILAVRDAEWYTGARSGTSDQAAMVLGRRGELVNVALLAEDFSTASAQRLAFPGELRVLVVNSFTERSLSGAQLVTYTQNRFAYSMALSILRHELEAMGLGEDLAAGMDRLSRVTPDALGGMPALYAVLKRIPEDCSLDAMKDRYVLPDFDSAYERYFGDVPEAQRPKRIGLRGPLLFGIAESERARHFFPVLARDTFEKAGRLMSVGHDGDRVTQPDGTPYTWDAGDAALDRLAAANTPI